MGEKRAVQVSHELWRQMMTQGYTSAGVRCVEGIPEDAELVHVFARDISSDGRGGARSDPVFVFESDSWAKDLAFDAYSIKSPSGDVMPLIDVLFRAAECRTCTWWVSSEDDLPFCMNLMMPRPPDFGCAEYETRDTQ